MNSRKAQSGDLLLTGFGVVVFTIIATLGYLSLAQYLVNVSVYPNDYNEHNLQDLDISENVGSTLQSIEETVNPVNTTSTPTTTDTLQVGASAALDTAKLTFSIPAFLAQVFQTIADVLDVPVVVVRLLVGLVAIACVALFLAVVINR